MKSVSIVVPVFNEEGNVKELHHEIVEVCEANGYTYEIIFVDDGSTDRTVEICKTLKHLKLICLRKNFGQTAAMDAGIKEAKHDYIVTMDGDRQNDPADIPKMIEYLEENKLDVVSGWRKNRKDTFFKKFTSRVANLLRHIIVHDGIHDSGCSLKVYKKECFEGVSLYGEMHRFIPAVLKMKGFSVGEVVVNHRPRMSGKTKYNWKRTFKGFVDMISLWFWDKYSSRPLHLFGSSGIILLMCGGLAGIISAVGYIQRGKIGDTAWPLLTALFIISGIQFFIFGLLADITAKIYHEETSDKSYSVKCVMESNEK